MILCSRPSFKALRALTSTVICGRRC